MASIYYLNQASHPFWDMFSGQEGHPFFGPHPRGPPPPPPPHHTHPHGYPGHGHSHGPGAWHNRFQYGFQGGPGNENQTPNQDEEAGQEGAASSDHNTRQDDTVPANNTSGQTRGLGDNTTEKSEERFPRQRAGRGRGGQHGLRGGFHGHEHPFRGCPAGFGPGPDGGRGRSPPRFRGGRGRDHHPRGHFGAPPPFPGGLFNVQPFLERLRSQFGIDLDQMWTNYWNDNQNDNQVDFVPRADIFDTPAEYLVQVSLPGAQKPDISVDYDVEESVLRLAGVVYRPDINEELSNALVIDERSREVGVFERNVKLGTRTQSANVDADNISAKLADGILTVRLPKFIVNPEKLKKKVSVEAVNEEKNSKHTTVNEVPDETEAMHRDSETEKGDIDEDLHTDTGAATPTHVSDEENYDEEGKEYVKVDVA